MKIVQAGDNFDVNETASRSLLDQVLSRPLFAHLATASEQGPRESPVWFLWEEEALWIIGNHRTDTFPKRIEREPRCAIGIVDFDIITGFVQHVGFRGRARLEPHDAARMKRLLRRYLGQQEQRWDPRFLAVPGDRDWVLIRFEPETAVVRDQSYQVNKDVPA
ncbi:MAG: pyridoxamine 5'-phosphate oxidase family protein [Pyrinomonadaceae bacterium]